MRPSNERRWNDAVDGNERLLISKAQSKTLSNEVTSIELKLV